MRPKLLARATDLVFALHERATQAELRGDRRLATLYRRALGSEAPAIEILLSVRVRVPGKERAA